VARFVASREHDRLALVVFGEEAFTQVPLTLDHVGLARFLGQVRIGQAGERRTAVGDAIAIACQRLAKLQAPSKLVILLTDGRSNAGQIEPVPAAEAAAAVGVKIYTIGVGPEPGQGGGFFGMFGSRGGDLDEPTLKAIAAQTGGRYFRAQDADTLEQVYETIGQLEPSTAEVKELTHYEERFAPWLLWGLGLVSLWVLLETTLFRRLP
jgi:Ca-activated chloride channel family protein